MSLWFTPKHVCVRESLSGENERLRYVADAMQGWRPSMEDAHIAVMQLPNHPHISMFAVMDGHGGAAVSKFCQEYMVGVVDQQLLRVGEDAIEVALKASFHAIDTMLRDRQHSKFLRHHNGPDGGGIFRKLLGGAIADEAGSTAIVALLKGDMLWVANAGDSRGVLCRSGKAIELSCDHKPYLQTEHDRITQAGGWVQEGRHRDYRVNGELSLSRAIGDLKFKKGKSLLPHQQIITAEPEVSRVKLTSEDNFFVLACDGVWDTMSSQAVVDFIQKGLAGPEGLAGVGAALLDKCVAKQPNAMGIGCDNMTAVIVQIIGPPVC